MYYKCPYPNCEKYFTSKKKLSDHQRKVHPAMEQEVTPAMEQEVTPAMEQEVTPATEQGVTPATEQEVTQGYHCIDCGAFLTKGQSSCPDCGTHLDWSQI